MLMNFPKILILERNQFARSRSISIYSPPLEEDKRRRRRRSVREKGRKRVALQIKSLASLTFLYRPPSEAAPLKVSLSLFSLSFSLFFFFFFFLLSSSQEKSPCVCHAREDLQKKRERERERERVELAGGAREIERAKKREKRERERATRREKDVVNDSSLVLEGCCCRCLCGHEDSPGNHHNTQGHCCFEKKFI